MELNKFESEIKTLKIFLNKYCEDNHFNQNISNITIEYKSKFFALEYNLCDKCKKQIISSIDKLLNCPHKIKPRCRNCPHPCYDKNEWKEIAKIMKYSAIKLSMSKIKSKIKNIFTF